MSSPGAVDTGFSAAPLADAGCGSRPRADDDRRADHRARGFRSNKVPRGSTPLDVQRRQYPRRRRSGVGSFKSLGRASSYRPGDRTLTDKTGIADHMSRQPWPGQREGRSEKRVAKPTGSRSAGAPVHLARSLLVTNPWLRDLATRSRQLALAVESSTAVEGVRVSLTCRCGHSALMHDSGGGCALCQCRGFRG